MCNVQRSICFMCICISILIATSKAAVIEKNESNSNKSPSEVQKEETQLYEAKTKLREQMKKKLTSMSPKEIDRQSKLITKQLLNHPIYEESRRVSIYISMDYEVQTRAIIKNIFATHRQCFIPKYDKNNTLTMLKINSLEDLDSLPKTKSGIPQPADGDVREDAMKTGGLDLIIVPGLAFTDYGKRLGRGRGCYDRFLEKYDEVFPDNFCMSIGLAFEEQIVDDIPCTRHDKYINYVIIPKNYAWQDAQDGYTKYSNSNDE